MARTGYNVVEARLWKDHKVRSLPPTGRLMWLWLLTNRAANFPGVYELSIGTAAKDTGLSRKVVETHLRALEEGGMIRHDPELGVVWVVRRMGLECATEFHWTGASRQVRDYACASFIPEMVSHYPSLRVSHQGGTGGATGGPTPPPTGGHDHDHDHDHEDTDMSSGDDRSRLDSNGKDTEPWGPGESSDGVLNPPGLAYLWNLIAPQYGCPRVMAFRGSRQRTAKAAVKDEASTTVWAKAMHAICDDEFLGGKNDRGTVYATFDYAIRPSKRERWLDQARAENEEVIP